MVSTLKIINILIYYPMENSSEVEIIFSEDEEPDIEIFFLRNFYICLR